MSNSQDFSSSAIAIGTLVPFQNTLANSLSINGQTFLKTGVTALASTYPQVPLSQQVLLPQNAGVVATPVVFTSIVAAPSIPLWVATDGTSIYSSTDGVTWTLRQAFTATLVYWTGTMFLAINTSTTYWTSANGTTGWTSATLFPNAPSPVSANKTICQVGTNIIVNSNTTTYNYSSNSGTTWSTQNYPAGSTYAAGYLNTSSSTFIYVYNGNSLYTSTVGVTWAAVPVLPTIDSAVVSVYSDGISAYIPIVSYNQFSARWVASIGLPFALGLYKTSDGINYTYAGSTGVIPSSNGQNSGGVNLFSTNTGLYATTSDVTNPVLVPTNSTGNATGINQGAIAYMSGVYLAIYPNIPFLLKLTTPALLINNITSSSNAAGSRNYMRVA